jgi:17 kDa outer membrane surface antigen
VAGAISRCFSCRLYNGCVRARLWRALPLAGALTLALAGGGCSISSSRFNSLFGGDDKPNTTGSVTHPPGAKGAGELPPAGDLAYARAAASDVLSRGGKDASAPWENPRTGARGTVTPIASAYTQDGQTCRDFLASYVSGRSQAWMQGEACKREKGIWEVRALKPWKRS